MSDAAKSIHNGFKKAFTHMSDDDIAMCWAHVRQKYFIEKFAKIRTRFKETA